MEHKIGIVTNYTNTKNYGSTLQSYALQTTLRALGYECENIQYTYERRSKSKGRKFLGFCKRTLRNFVVRDRIQKFTSFRRKYIRESSTIYESLESLSVCNKRYRCFVSGSDQIWNPFQYNDWYYLSFVNDSSLKVSYAPSFGTTELDAHLRPRIQKFLNRYDFISVREETGAKIIHDLIGVRPTTVLDPVMLVDKKYWVDISNTKIRQKESYALCYFLGDNKDNIRLAKQICEKEGVKMLFPYARQHDDQCDKVLSNVGPLEFIELINNSSFVLTDSFHGTLFSVILQKKFLTFKRFIDTNMNSENSRINDFLTQISLIDRLVSLADSSHLSTLLNDDVDYELVEEKVSVSRLISLEYLKKSLNNA